MDNITHSLAGMLAAVLPMCLATSAMQSSVATMARSFKEAQTYLGMLMMLPMLPGATCQERWHPCLTYGRPCEAMRSRVW